jgi:hypothetical protein
MVHQLHEVYFYVVLCNCFNCIVGGMFSVLASSAVNPALEPRSVQTNDYAIGICCFSAKHTTLRQKSKDWLTRNNGRFLLQAGIKLNISEFIFIFDLVLRFYCSEQKSRKNTEIKSY